MPGGIGCWAVEVGQYRVAALAAVNAVGDVLNDRGEIVAGARADDGTFLDSRRLLRETGGTGSGTPGNTTLCVVATDAPLDRRDLHRMARMAAGALPSRIRPVNSPMDGDLVFALAPSRDVAPLADGEVMAIGEGARNALEEAITRSVRSQGDDD